MMAKNLTIQRHAFKTIQVTGVIRLSFYVNTLHVLSESKNFKFTLDKIARSVVSRKKIFWFLCSYQRVKIYKTQNVSLMVQI
jgi:type IV secretory pathway VirB3-like protein